MELVKEGSGSQESRFNGMKRDASGVFWDRSQRGKIASGHRSE